MKIKEEICDDSRLFELFTGTIVIFVANRFIRKYGDKVYGTREELIDLVSKFVLAEIGPFVESEFPRLEKETEKIADLIYNKIMEANNEPDKTVH